MTEVIDLINRRFDDLKTQVSELKQELNADLQAQNNRILELEKLQWKTMGSVTVIVFLLQFLYDRYFGS